MQTLQKNKKSHTSNTITARFQVDYHYQVIMTKNVFSLQNSLLSELIATKTEPGNPQKIYCIIDQGIIDAQINYTTEIKNYFQYHNITCYTQVIPGGEQSKTSAQTEQLIQQMLAHELDRHNWVIAIGGGAVLDSVGFACTIFHRGIRLIRMPSTVLAQNDAGIGVKNGINAFQQKNLIGTFAPPYAVINDATLLTSLSERDKRSGLAEAVKVALIRDREFFNWLQQNADKLRRFESDASQYAIYHCAQNHIEHIAGNGDPFETGNGRPLDFGHWSAHKIESLAHYQIRHGEAVAIGIVLDALYARELGWLSPEKTDQIIQLIIRLGFAIWHAVMDILDAQGQPLFMTGLESFRQHLGGKLSIPVLTDIGQYRNVETINDAKLNAALTAMKQLAGKVKQ